MKKNDAFPQLPPTEDWLIGGGEMGKLVRAMDWSKTPLGLRDAWPQSLRTTVNLCLNSNFPIAIAWGPEYTQLYNDGYWPITGAKHPQSMGQNFWECWPTSRPAIGKAFDQAEAGEAAFLTNHRIFLDRHGYLEETFFTFSFSPIRDEQGAVGGLFHPVTELTQQTLGERRLQSIRALADATADAGTVDDAARRAAQALARHELDLPFVLLYLVDAGQTQARLAGCSGLAPDTPAAPALVNLNAEEGKGWPLTQLLASRRYRVIEDLEQRFGSLVCGPYPEPLQSAVLMPITLSGMDRAVGVLIAGISTRRALDSAYRSFYEMLWNGVSTAMSNARALEFERERAEALAEIDRAKTTFFSNVSHEFRTPLTLMLGPLKEALDDTSRTLSEADRHRLETAHRNSLRLHKLVNSLLDFARIEAGRAEASYVPTDLAACTADLASMFRSALESAGLELIIDCPPLPEPVYVDPDLWEKIVLNLISNAFKFTFTGRITVRLRWQNGSAVLDVTDTGVGIPAEHLPRLFERFHRVPNTRSRTYEGSGIGLALVHELVKLHQGTVTVASSLDEGTTFSVTLPGGTAHLPAERLGARPARASTAIKAQAFVEDALHWLPDEGGLAASDEPPAAQGQCRILLADDNADMRRYVQGLLARHWQVEAVADGKEALDAARRTRPDLVLSDIMMPRLDGFGLLAALRANQRTCDIPVILLSARAGEEARVEGLDAGADDYLVKPFGAQELFARVRTSLDMVRLRRQAVELARHDPLTGLPNRGLSYEFAERLLAGARRGHTRMALLFVDMDRFKVINDTFGHETGDKVLQEVARRLKAAVRVEDTVGRLGGDEFLVVLSHIQNAADAGQVAQHLIDSLGQAYSIDGLELHSSPSIGIALFPGDGGNLDALLSNADAAMYHAKENGRHNFQFYRPELNERTALAQRIEARLVQALQKNELTLHYQPIVDIATGAVIGAEALARWPAMGVGPGEFIPVAEASGMIEPLSDWIFGEACRQLRQWREQGLPSLTLSINISPLQFRKAGLSETIARTLTEQNIDAHSIQIELSETSLVNNADEAIAIMGTMKGLGLKIALDDFGRGYSSLSYLSRLPIDTLKVDQGFVQTLASEPASLAVIEAIVAIGRKLGLQVVAEGIESEDTLTTLRDTDCPHMQGYYLCPPVTADAFAAWYHQHQGL